jgi:hypothetical protein
MTQTTALAEGILQANLGVTPLDLIASTQDNLWVTLGQSANIIAQDNNYKNKLDPVQTQDVIYSQWYAQRRANYEITKKYPGTVNPEKKYSFEWIDLVNKVLIDEVQWVSAGGDEVTISGKSGTIPDFVIGELNKLAHEAGEIGKKAAIRVRDWAQDLNKKNSQLFAEKNTPELNDTARDFSYANLDTDNTLTFSHSFFKFTSEIGIQDWLIFQLGTVKYQLGIHTMKVKLPTDRLAGGTHDALVKKYNDQGKNNIDNGPI